MEEAEEGCLSFPDVNLKIKRHKEIRVRFQTPSGNTTSMTFNGLTARVFQHELDHLDGKLFINRAKRVHRDIAMRKYYNARKVG
jgi:peptide deformylase